MKGVWRALENFGDQGGGKSNNEVAKWNSHNYEFVPGLYEKWW